MSNVLDIIKRAGVDVIWRENNTGAKGIADRITFEDYNSSSVNTICDVECRDPGMVATIPGSRHSTSQIVLTLDEL